jgi:integrase
MTDAWLKGVKSPNGQTDFRDVTTRGLVLRVSPGGTKQFYAVVPVGQGQRRRVPIGKYPSTGLAKARTIARDHRERAELGELANATRMTVAQLIEAYAKRHLVNLRSGEEAARRLRKNISGAIGTILLGDLHRREIQRALDAMTDRGAPIEANRTYQDVRALLNWAYRRGDIDKPILLGMSNPNPNNIRERVLNIPELAIVWRALPSLRTTETIRNVLRLLMLTGARATEGCGINLAELELDEGRWTLPAARSKNKHAHSMPLSDMALTVIREQIAINEADAAERELPVTAWLFPGKGRRAAIQAKTVSGNLQGVNDAEQEETTIGMEHFVPHDLRRSFATALAEMGVSEFIIGHLLNHRTTTKATVTGRVYQRYDYWREKTEAAQAWADRLRTEIEKADAVTEP